MSALASGTSPEPQKNRTASASKGSIWLTIARHKLDGSKSPVSSVVMMRNEGVGISLRLGTARIRRVIKGSFALSTP
jgi:hypothetical protein